MTPCDLRVLKIIRAYIREHGISPTFEEMAAIYGGSKNTVYDHVQRLAKAGKVTFSPHIARSIRLVRNAGDAVIADACAELRDVLKLEINYAAKAKIRGALAWLITSLDAA